MDKLNEDKTEEYTIELLQNIGYAYIHAATIAPDSDNPERQLERQNYNDVILKNRLTHAINTINPHIPLEAREQAQRIITTISSPDLINNNETFHKYLTEGIDIEYQLDGITRGDKVWLIDFQTPENNEFLAVNQFTIIENNHNRRPDIILFINGLPLVVIELKNPADEKATIEKAFNQLGTYKAEIPSLFTYNAFLIIADGLEARVGSLSADFSRFLKWKLPHQDQPKAGKEIEIETVIKGLCNKTTILDFIRHFTVFEKTKQEHPQTKITTIKTIKKIAAYHQYYAVNKAVDRVIQAVNQPVGIIHELSLQNNDIQTRKGGVLWHTQGSGKSLSMVFLTGKLVLTLDNPTIVVLTDRNDLDDQLFDTFAASRQLLRQEPQQAENRQQVQELLNVASGGIVFTTVQKFSPQEGETIYPLISPRANIVVLADEAHRSQYGFKAREIDIKDENGVIIGKQTRYGFAKYIRDALPHATFVGFTGTPVEKTDQNTPAVFGDYIDIYDIAQAVTDGATVPIYYESRLVKIDLDETGKQLLAELDEDLEGLGEGENVQQAKAQRTKLEAVIGATQRLETIAQDIIQHFETRQQVFFGKGMIVTFSRAIAVQLYQEIINLRPEWGSNQLDQGTIKVVMTAGASDGAEMAKHHTSKRERSILAGRLKDPQDSLQLVIVCDMWLTGFDAPCLHTLYIDKPMKGHNLMQAIARVNRVYLDKPGGLIVDYLGIGNDLREALAFYAESGGKGEPTLDQEAAINLMLTKLEIVEQLMAGCAYSEYFTSDTGRKLQIILEAEEHILSLENGKDRFNQEVTALSQAFALAVPSAAAMNVAAQVSFFQAVKARLQKFDSNSNGLSHHDISTAIKQVVDQALVSEGVIDIFDAAGIKKPDISILSDSFMAEIRGLEHKNLAVELLKKLLNDEIRTRQKTNLVQSRSLKELLENTLRKYQNRVISAAEVIEELINIAKEVTKADQRGEELGLSNYELAFYDALAENDSARDVMGVDKLRELAIVLVQRIQKNASIDWNIKENVRARMKVMVKRLLREYGYPPDMQALATELVLEQAKLFRVC
ncbi:type I restriction endonuclease subunit R [Anabaena aphanizomenioides LEGE 00250]|uniref:Type I restriction enzyme endonuclease subunit n=1 Tax=Sphaerospermopsis aphanizomenoides LEGE 00250 TaxID=2777972 RepID=A0ABR9VKU2_9CYAN|nr:type I restriction endonuclease subunit R [Sphaerospermopsis aphanizomenoides]MBE9239098.1 type I restriction endonuclease subunit R [Sphaerospermopsis aphanizomenoides LEGE 00250]